jgi:membrane protease YdiL (CAAX protease family)
MLKSPSLIAWLGLIGASTFLIHRASHWPFIERSRALLLLTIAQGVFGTLWARKLKVPWGQLTHAWKSLVLVLVGFQIAEHTLVAHASPSHSDPRLWLATFIQSVVLIGFVEELWFRGIWFHLWKARFIPAIGLGSVLFGVYHWPHGPWVVLSTTGVGFALAAARSRGASLLGLALVHGTNNWINQTLLPGINFRFSQEIVALSITLTGILIGLCLLRDGSINLPSTPPTSPRST